MQSFDEIRREAEEAKERLRRDVLELRDLLSRVARETGEAGRVATEASLKAAQLQIEEAMSQAEKRFEKALEAVTCCNFSYDDFVTRDLDLKDFSNVEVDCAFRVDIKRADACKVSIWASEDMQKEVNAQKSGNSLKLSLKSHSFRARPIVRAVILMPRLSRVRLGGATNGTVTGFESREDFDLNLSGNSALEVEMASGGTKCEISGASRLSGTMKMGDAEFVLSGASRLILAGSAKNVTLSAWGASKAEAGGLAMNDATVHLKGASEATINGVRKLDVDLSGGSRLTYSGNPVISSMSVTGASSLNHKVA